LTWLSLNCSTTAGPSGTAVCEHELEGVVAKRLNEPYRPGYRGSVKTKNRDYWRYDLGLVQGQARAAVRLRPGHSPSV
jgi:ATP-dependent DNA ligase